MARDLDFIGGRELTTVEKALVLLNNCTSQKEFDRVWAEIPTGTKLLLVGSVGWIFGQIKRNTELT